MLKIGIVGGNEISNTASFLQNILLSRGIITKTSDYMQNNLANYNNEFGKEIVTLSPEVAEVLIEKIYTNKEKPKEFIENDFDMLIINSLDEEKDIYINDGKGINLKNSSIILLNSDEKNISKILQRIEGNSKIITYGLNSKACVTASSISDSTIQCCIQRALPTFSGEVLEQQEFTINVDTRKNDVNIILAAVTAALVNDSNTNFD